MQVDATGAASGGSPRYPVIDLARAARDADLVLLSSEPYAFTADHVADVRQRLTSERHRPHVRLIDGEWASWYGSRAIEGLDRLARAARETAIVQST